MKVGRLLVLGGVGCALLAWRPAPPRLMWNATASVPVGLYALSPASRLARGDLVVIRPPGEMVQLLAARGWLPPGVPLVKPVAALDGQLACRSGAVVSIDGLPVAMARRADTMGRTLPAWAGCQRLQPGEVLVLSAVPGSFDGRYFGVLPGSAIAAKARPLWIPRAPAEREGEAR